MARQHMRCIKPYLIMSSLQFDLVNFYAAYELMMGYLKLTFV